MKAQFYISFWSVISLSILLILPGCMSVSGSQNVVQNTNSAIFNNKKIAILPVKAQASLAPDSVMAMRIEVNKRLAPSLRTKIPSAIVTDVLDVADQLNQTNTLTNFEQLISSYEATGIMDKRQVVTLGQALDCDYLLLSRLKSEKLDIGFISKGAGASLDVMLISVSTGEISWAGSGEWKKGGILGQGGASFSELAENIVTPAFESLQSNGDSRPSAIMSETKETPVASQAPIEKKKISRRVVTKVQQQLLDLGYTPGPADGKMGKGTIKAIKQFQQENHLTETGQADKKTISMLEQKTKEHSVQPQSAATTLPQAENIDTLPPSSSAPATVRTTEQNTVPAKTASPMDL